MAQSSVSAPRSARFAVRPGRLVRRLAAALLIALLVGYGAISAYAAERFSHPIRQPVAPCATYQLPCEDVQFTSVDDNVPLSGWLIAGTRPQTIMIMHGRDGRRDDPTIGLIDIARALHAQGYGLLMFDFRAHGLSGGDRYSAGDWERRDVAGALRFLTSRGVTSIGALGFSMGAAIALRAAPAHPEMRALVLDSPFSNVGPIIDMHLTEVSGLPRIFTPGLMLAMGAMYGMDLFNDQPRREMAQLGSRPVLLIHSKDDEFVPVSQAYDLQAAGAQDPNLQVWITSGPLHVRSYKMYPTEYMRRVTDFFAANLR